MISQERNGGESKEATISRLRTVRYSIAQLFLMIAFISPIVVWLINEHYENKSYHDRQEMINQAQTIVNESVERRISVMSQQHSMIMGQLDVVTSNQTIVLESISGVRQQNYGIRRAIETATGINSDSLKPRRR